MWALLFALNYKVYFSVVIGRTLFKCTDIFYFSTLFCQSHHCLLPTRFVQPTFTKAIYERLRLSEGSSYYTNDYK